MCAEKADERLDDQFVEGFGLDVCLRFDRAARREQGDRHADQHGQGQYLVGQWPADALGEHKDQGVGCQDGDAEAIGVEAGIERLISRAFGLFDPPGINGDFLRGRGEGDEQGGADEGGQVVRAVNRHQSQACADTDL